ncbi:DUF169 domain-containing protein [Methanohalobium evestigatum]|uniref:DUF169 domain-containing protein n=1 Tax=Methanohalobium evestigatum TaxID=2322 RepID=UPI00067793B7|nr:DUF169 domain-containing protein [Methanohalobium evestigatum]
MNINEINKTGRKIIEVMGLTTPPVAIMLTSNIYRIPESIDKIDNNMSHCQMVNKIREESVQFYAFEENQQCKNGAAVMGMRELNPEFANGNELYNEGHYKDRYLAKETIQQIPKLEPNSVKAIIYGPLNKADFIPDIVLFIGNPENIMQISRGMEQEANSFNCWRNASNY